MPELFSKRSGRLYGKVYNKSEKTSINTRKKEIDIGKSDKKTTELLFKSLILEVFVFLRNEFFNWEKFGPVRISLYRTDENRVLL